MEILILGLLRLRRLFLSLQKAEHPACVAGRTRRTPFKLFLWVS